MLPVGMVAVFEVLNCLPVYLCCGYYPQDKSCLLLSIDHIGKVNHLDCKKSLAPAGWYFEAKVR